MPSEGAQNLGLCAAGELSADVYRAMAHAQRRLASVSVSSLKSFPPKEALASSGSSAKFFAADKWASLQPAPPSAFSAFAHRIGLGEIVSLPELQQACTHPSVLPLHAKHRPHDPAPLVNTNLATVGNYLLGLFAAEHLNASFPHLPTRALKAAVSAYVGPVTCANIAKEMGAAPLLRWHRMVRRRPFSAWLEPIVLCAARDAYASRPHAS